MPKKPPKPNPAAPVVADTPAAPPAVDATGGPTPVPAPSVATGPTEAPVPAPSPPAGPFLDVAAYQARQYDAPRCWSLVSAIYAEVVGRNPTEVQTVSESMRDASRAFRLALYKTSEGLQRLAEPQDFAIVLMWPTTQRRRPHCGIFYAGSVLHATPDGNLYQDMASLTDAYPVMEFWR